MMSDGVEKYKEDWFRVGDIVTRDGTDLHRVVETNGSDEYAPDMIVVECIKEPLGYLNADGTRDPPWAKIGEQESNLARRYSFAADHIDNVIAIERL